MASVIPGWTPSGRLAAGLLLLVTCLSPSVRADPPAEPKALDAAQLEALLTGELQYGRLVIGLARPKEDGVEEAAPFRSAYAPTSLSGAAFYEAIERPDLVSAWRTRRALRIALPIVAGAMSVAGMLTGAFASEWRSSRDEENAVIGGSVLLIVGMGGLITSLFIGPNVMSMDEARVAVDEHNRTLRRNLHLPPLELLQVPVPPPPPVSVLPWVGPHGAGLGLALRF